MWGQKPTTGQPSDLINGRTGGKIKNITIIILQTHFVSLYKAKTTRMYSFKDYIFRTLLRYNAGSLQDIAKISLGHAVLLALGRSLGRELDGIHLRPLHLDTGEGHPRTFDTDQPLHGVKLGASIDLPLHETEVAAGYGFDRPQQDY